MSAPSVLDAMALGALPRETRDLLAAEVRRAYRAGFTEAVRLCEADAALGMDWRLVPDLDARFATLWCADELRPLLGEGVAS